MAWECSRQTAPQPFWGVRRGAKKVHATARALPDPVISTACMDKNSTFLCAELHKSVDAAG
jgi:hypothetical protein